MLEIKNMDIFLYPRYLIKGLSFCVDKKDKLAIIGEEGNGKSTLLKALIGKCDYAKVTGEVNLHGNKVGYLEQNLNRCNSNKIVFDYLFNNYDDYYEKINLFYQQLNNFNLSELVLKQKMGSLSGGENVKVRLLKLLLDEVDVYLLDEPTNDLDIQTLEWLEKFINQTDKIVIYISHDETLLSNTANMILHLEQIKRKSECRHTILKIDYDTYVEKRLNKIEHQTQMARFERRDYQLRMQKLQKLLQKVEYQQNNISRGDPHGGRLLKKKMHNLKSQESKLSQMDLTQTPDVEEGISFEFEPVDIARNKVILDLNIDQLKVENKVLANKINLKVIGTSHIAIIGPNGVGKTTLMKRIYQELVNRKDINVGYMPQDYEDIFNNCDKVIDFVSKGKSKSEITKARQYLGSMKFTSDEMIGKISDLSNGSKAKLILIKFVLDQCNVLLLDEPTRNVSPLSNPLIREELRKFSGTIISISHDRKFIAQVVDKIYLLTKDGLELIE